MTSAKPWLAVAEPATCAFPGCERPVRERAGEGGGKPPIYCDLLNPAGKLAHTPLTAARERTRLAVKEQATPPGQAAAATGEAPATAARTRAVSLLEQFQAAAGQMTSTLQHALEAFAAAGDPDSVSAELTGARRTMERARLEADERVQAAEDERVQAVADAKAARQEAGEAASARDEAITELENVEAELENARQEHAAKLERVRGEAAEQVAAAQQRAEAVIAEAQQRVQAAEQARDQAHAEAVRAGQAATDATRHADEAREELRQVRADHRQELAAERQRADAMRADAANQVAEATRRTDEVREELRQVRVDHRQELAAERQRADATLQATRAEHDREIQALQAALDTLRTAHTDTTSQD